VLVPLSEAVTSAATVAETAEVDTEKLAVDEPAPTVTAFGTPIEPPAAAMLTVTPPLGAGRLSVTTPEEGLPPITEAGEIETLDSNGVNTVKLAVWAAPADDAEIVADVLLETMTVEIGKDAELEPA
jgi:hypothetical protein